MNEKKHNLFYKITNLINGKFYYGIHSTNNIDDGYMGSGGTIKKAVEKYGIENFSKKIIADYPTRKEASNHEKEVVTLELIQLEECYNRKTGGDNENTHSIETKKRLSEVNKGKRLSDETKAKMSITRKGRLKSEEHRKKISNTLLGETHGMRGKTHSEETRKKMSESHSGEKNHFFGKQHDAAAKLKIALNNASSKSCIIAGIIYISMADAARKLDMTVYNIKYRITSKDDEFKEWTYYE